MTMPNDLLKKTRLFATHPHACSYLEGQTARTVFIDPEAQISTTDHSTLSALGFRRSGAHYYQPYCENCSACIPCRVPVGLFQPSKRFNRILNRNQDLNFVKTQSIDSEEHYSLYSNYINQRHRDGDMYPATREQYDSFLSETCPGTQFIEMRNPQNKLAGIIVADFLDHSMSAVYTYFDPEEHKRSLGTMAILWQIQKCKSLGFEYLYLGYWIKNSDKMRYKTQFRPIELLVNGKWSKLN